MVYSASADLYVIGSRFILGCIIKELIFGRF